MAGLLGFGRDTLQAASNAIAGNVSGPVDLINSGLLSIGLPMPRQPFGGSAWMADRGLTREVADPYARAAGETLGLVGPMVTAAKAPQIAQGMLDHAEAYRRYHAATTAPGAPATVWHGSPHRFSPEPGAPLGRFRADKIGTGEGAQAQGYGLYLAERPEVARHYMKQAGTYGPLDGFHMSQRAESGIKRLLNRADRSGDYTSASVYDELIQGDFTPSVLRSRLSSESLTGKERELAERALKRGERIINSDRGYLYRADLPDEAIAGMLDWNRPLPQQTEAVKKALAPRVAERNGGFYVDVGPKAGSFKFRTKAEAQAEANVLARSSEQTGEDFYTALGLGNDVQAAQRLREFGIPGIRYLDSGSLGTGAGTSNYVVFPGNENLLTILSRE